MTFGNKAYDGYTPYPEVLYFIALSYFLAKENHDILIEECICMSFSAMIN